MESEVKLLTNFTNFVVFNPLSFSQLYQSNQSGILGLGPFTTDDGDERDDSITYELKRHELISKTIVTYNITFNPNAVLGSQSYIQIGDLSDQVTRDLTWVTTAGWDYFKSPVSLTFLKTSAGKILPFAEFNTTAIFDTEADYMYINQLEYDEMLQPLLKSLYNDIECNENECHFNKACDAVTKLGTEIHFSVSTDEQHYVHI